MFAERESALGGRVSQGNDSPQMRSCRSDGSALEREHLKHLFMLYEKRGALLMIAMKGRPKRRQGPSHLVGKQQASKKRGKSMETLTDSIEAAFQKLGLPGNNSVIRQNSGVMPLFSFCCLCCLFRTRYFLRVSFLHPERFPVSQSQRGPGL